MPITDHSRVRDLRSIKDADLAVAVNNLGEWLSQQHPHGSDEHQAEYQTREARFYAFSQEQAKRAERDARHAAFLANQK